MDGNEFLRSRNPREHAMTLARMEKHQAAV
jgi:hypothetical protein